jgi:nucleotide-binding universal stress UspA family protein
VAFPVKRILCPTDFSAASVHAFGYALALGQWFHAHVSVVHVHALRFPVSAFVPFAGPEDIEPLSPTDIERDQLADNLRVFVEAEARDRRNVTWHLDESTDVADSIVTRARALDVQLIVIGTHGGAGLRRHFVGSITERVLRGASCAVLAVPPQITTVLSTVPRLDRVVCAIDFSTASVNALDCAVALAGRVGAALTVAHIIELPPDVPDLPQIDLSGYRHARFDHARASMQQALSGRRSANLRIDELLLAGRAGPELARLAVEQQADVVVMGVHGRHALDLLVFGSVTHYMVRHAACPVLTARA